MATNKPKPVKFLEEAELLAAPSLYQPGKPLQWVMSYGWVLVGFYVRHESPLKVRVAHANYYIRAGKTHADLAREGAGDETKWCYLGNTEISVPHVLFTDEYFGEVPRGPIRLR